MWKKQKLYVIASVFLLGVGSLVSGSRCEDVPDWRHIGRGQIIPDLSYSDMPYILKTDDGAWLCCLTLPDGEIGLRTPPGGGPVAAEHSYSLLSDGSIYCVYRTIDGHPVNCYSRDGGHTWEPPQYKRYADGRLMKHPRAANFAWRCSNGKFLYWFHNHGGRFIKEHSQRASNAYNDRNPVWLCGGIETDSPSGKIIRWTQPEILIYDDDPFVRMSYPDLVEESGEYYVTETQKDVARVHRIDPQLLDLLWKQFDLKGIAENGLVLSLDETDGQVPNSAEMPSLRRFVERDRKRKDYGTKDLRTGFSLDVWFQLESLEPGQALLDNRNEAGKGVALVTTEKETIEIVLNDGRTDNRWDCDPGLIEPNTLHHLVVTVDGGPKIITFVVDGKLCDGADHRQFGWGRFSPHLSDVIGANTLRIGPNPEPKGPVKSLRIYDRCLLTSEAIGNYRAGR